LKFNIKEWQGRDNYRLCDVAALWNELPPQRPDDRLGMIDYKMASLKFYIRSKDLECDTPYDEVKPETTLTADALRKYVEKHGKEMPKFLK